MRTTGIAAAMIALLLAGIIAAEDLPKEKSIVNSLGMQLVRIEPGSFSMGSTTGDFDEKLVHRVSISRPFYLAVTEVTNAQYEQFDPEHRKLRGKFGFSQEGDEAVVFVDWNETQKFCRWLSQKEARPYRLPTEAEWEYACRAGTTTDFHTGNELADREFKKNVGSSWFPSRPDKGPISLRVAQTPPNPWGLFDMHGNLEEWCHDWYGSYEAADEVDPVGRATGDFRVTRGGSHSTELRFLRSANRSGTLPADKSWLIGFRVVLGELPKTSPLPALPAALHASNVRQEIPAGVRKGPDPAKPFFKGPRPYVKVPPNSNGPLFSKHNHDPAIVECPNGDLLAVWYTCLSEPGRELGLAASRLRYGTEEWDDASPFWDAPDRNDHAPALWSDGRKLYHFVGLSAAATWGNLAVVMRTSDDNGATWSAARLIAPEHTMRHQPVETVIQTRDGAIVLPCDAVPGGSGGTAVLISRDGGQTWSDPGEGKPAPQFQDGVTGAWIAGIHAGLVELNDGRLMAFGRSNDIAGRMPMSISADGGRTWTYSPSPFPPIGSGQRMVVLRLREGPIFLASFDKNLEISDAAGKPRKMSGLFGALSFDEGKTWPVRRLITDDGPARSVDGGGNTGKFTLGPESSEPRGYLSVCQGLDGVIHLIGSKNHYAMNLTWLRASVPEAASK